MPTASGAPTADEKREAERLARRKAVQTVTALVAGPEWYEKQADFFVAGYGAHKKGQAEGTIPGYQSFEQEYPAGEEFEVKVGRRTIKVDEGKARSHGVSDAVTRRGIDNHNIMTFGLYQGRSTVRYIVEAR